MASEADAAQGWVILAGFENRCVGEHMLAWLFLAGLDPTSQHDWLRPAVGVAS